MIFSFSLSDILISWMYLVFGWLVEQNKTFKDATLNSGKTERKFGTALFSDVLQTE